MNRINSHKRQNSTSSFTLLANDSFSSLDNFMNATKLMEDEIMVPCKLKEKNLTISRSHDSLTNGNGHHTTNGTNGHCDTTTTATTTTSTTNGTTSHADVHDHYKFIRFVRNQFLHSKPFHNIDDYNNNELKDVHFKKTLDELSYHYNGLMTILDTLSIEAKLITEVYRESV